MATQPGLIGYSARRELFGSEAWTMSVWASDAARARFVRSAVHQEAIAKSEPAIVTVRLKRLNMARKDVPRDWAGVLALLAQPGNERLYTKD
jgi:heme-degrading monooxygenase HmoA